MKDLYKVTRLLSMMLVSTLIVVYLGYHIDQWLHTTPLFIFLGVIYTIGGSLYLLTKTFDESYGSNKKDE